MKREWGLLPTPDWKNTLPDPQELSGRAFLPVAGKD
jgi:hypothetical protein